jgi:hypothetical protein
MPARSSRSPSSSASPRGRKFRASSQRRPGCCWCSRGVRLIPRSRTGSTTRRSSATLGQPRRRLLSATSSSTRRLPATVPWWWSPPMSRPGDSARRSRRGCGGRSAGSSRRRRSTAGGMRSVPRSSAGAPGGSPRTARSTSGRPRSTASSTVRARGPSRRSSPARRRCMPPGHRCWPVRRTSPSGSGRSSSEMALKAHYAREIGPGVEQAGGLEEMCALESPDVAALSGWLAAVPDPRLNAAAAARVVEICTTHPHRQRR